jgi:Fe-S oxidoreductase
VQESAGFEVEVPRRTVCCGVTWISTGQLVTAKRVLRHTLSELSPALRTSTPIVVLEPSCAAPDWKPAHHDAHAVVRQHCHQHAGLGYTRERKLLADADVETEVLDAGCCGLAGNFGFEKGHYDVSVACAEDKLLPALRDADPASLVLADGFSCRTQIRELAPECRPLHVAQVLAGSLPAGSA